MKIVVGCEEGCRAICSIDDSTGSRITVSDIHAILEEFYTSHGHGEEGDDDGDGERAPLREVRDGTRG